MNQNKVLSLLGLAMKGRNLVSGEFQTEESVKKGSAKLVIVAEDASGNTKKLFGDKCSFYHVPIYIFGTKESLGKAIGKELRSSLGVCDAGLAAAIIRQLDNGKSMLPQDHGMRGDQFGSDRNGGKHGEN